MIKNFLSNNLKVFLLILFLSPGFLWIFLNFSGYAAEWANTPSYAATNIKSLFSEDRLKYINEVRWNAFGPAKEDLPSKLFYNKGFLVIEHFYNFLTFLSPRIYFQAGDNTGFSPQTVEPIAFFLFFFWVMGILFLFRKKNFKTLSLPLIFGFLAYLVGQRTMPFLFPVMILYIYFSFLGVTDFLKDKQKRVFIVIFVLYSLFLIGRMFYLK